MDGKRLFESVCEVLSRHGFDPAPPQAPGLSVRLRPGAGLLLGWTPGQDLIGPTLHATSRPGIAGHPEFRGIRSALMLALSEILHAAGFTITTVGVDLLVTANPCAPATAEDPADAVTAITAAQRRRGLACSAVATV